MSGSRKAILGLALLCCAAIPALAGTTMQAAKGADGPTVAVLVHLQDIGDRTGSSGEWVGTKGESRRLEGFSFQLRNAPADLGIEYMCHLEGVGDTKWMAGGEFCGTRGESRRVEGFAVRLTGAAKDRFQVRYAGHLQDVGDTAEVGDGEFCGTRGQSRRLEALIIRVAPR